MSATCQAPRTTISTPEHKASPGACDCHIHIAGPFERFPLSEGRAYTPPEAKLRQYEHVQEVLGVQRVVIVQPSFYGTDNRCTLDAVAHFGAQRSRAVVVIDPHIGDAELRQMHEAGVRGVRVNLVTPGGPPVEHLTQLSQKIAPFGWHTQIYANGADLPDLMPILRRLPTDVVIDHMGQIPAAWGTAHPAVAALRALLDGGRAWLKLCGYRCSNDGYPFGDVDALATLFARVATERCMWGTDWPHPNLEGTMPDEGELLDALTRWAPSMQAQQRILVDNPVTLYGFDPQ
ncbi:amidohydrolase family protein [Paraburkholderia sp. IMGN_8]|uniref:amidohydrolase family protein n=1 Tax=Paraburkholderia sp. IMGN_8 TaxID=3136564 RepID=UPI003100D5BB